MGLRQLLGWIGDRASGDEPGGDVDQATRDIAARATDEALTPAALVATERSYRPLLEYLEDEEQPHYLFEGSELLIEDDEDNVVRNHPTRALQVVVTDERVVYVLGDRTADNVLTVPHEDVVDVYVDDVDLHRYLIVEAYHDPDAESAEDPEAAGTGPERDRRQSALATHLLGNDEEESNPTFFANVTIDGRPDELDDAVAFVRERTDVRRPPA